MKNRNFTLSTPVRQCGVICGDGVELMGLVSTAQKAGPEVVLLFIPGQFDNAYQQHKNHALLRSCAAAGYGCVLANSRGQDYYGYQRLYSDSARPAQYTWKLLGSSFEQVRDGHLDISAWLSYITELNPGARVVLVGHSHGAIKIAHYMRRDDASECVGAVALLSPSDDLANQHRSLGDRYDEALQIAQAQVNEGRPEALMPEWAFSAPMSAGTYAEAFGPDSPLRIFAFHNPQSSPLWDNRGWPQPTLVMFGAEDIATGELSSEEAGEIARQLLKQSSRADAMVLPNTNHHYRGAEEQAATSVLDWSQAVLQP